MSREEIISFMYNYTKEVEKNFQQDKFETTFKKDAVNQILKGLDKCTNENTKDKIL